MMGLLLGGKKFGKIAYIRHTLLFSGLCGKIFAVDCRVGSLEN